jgi:ATP-dependent RNA helicase A
LHKEIYAKEHGSTKQIASKAVAVSLVRQLYHMKIIEAYTGEKKKKEKPKVHTVLPDVETHLQAEKKNSFEFDVFV